MSRLPRTLVLCLALAAVLPPSAALSHQASGYYDVFWRTNPSETGAVLPTERALHWAFSPTFEEAGRADAIAATESWNEHAEALSFLHVGEVAEDPGMGSCGLGVDPVEEPINIARRGEIDGPSWDGGGILAVAFVCSTLVGQTAVHFTVTYDEAEPWHFGPGPVPFDRFDLQGILAHEFGHATGWGRHFEDDTGTECVQVTRHTMCSTVHRGTEDPRTLEPHDIDTFQDAY